MTTDTTSKCVDKSRRHFIKTASYVAPVILTLDAIPTFASTGSPFTDFQTTGDSSNISVSGDEFSLTSDQRGVILDEIEGVERYVPGEGRVKGTEITYTDVETGEIKVGFIPYENDDNNDSFFSKVKDWLGDTFDKFKKLGKSHNADIILTPRDGKPHG